MLRRGRRSRLEQDTSQSRSKSVRCRDLLLAKPNITQSLLDEACLVVAFGGGGEGGREQPNNAGQGNCRWWGTA